MVAAPAFDPGNARQTDLPAAGRYLDQIVPLMEAERAQIRSAGQPEASAGLYASLLAALDDVIRDEQAAREAARSGDLKAYQAAFDADTSDSTHLAGVARQFGLTECAG